MRGPVRNAGYLFAGEAASRVFGFLTTALLARRLGVDGFGQIGFAAAVMAYGVVFADLGLVTIGTRSAAREPSSVSKLTGSLLPLRMLLGLLAALVIAAVALVLPRPASVRWLLVLYGVAVVIQSITLEWVFIGVEKMEFVSVARMVTSCGYFGLVFALVRRPEHLAFVPVAFGFACLAGALVLFLCHALRFGFPKLRLDTARWRELLRIAWPVGASTVLTQVHVNLGLVLLGLLATYGQTGVYNSAYRLVFFLMTLDRVFYTVYFPVVSRFFKDRPERLPELTGTGLRVVLALSLPLCAGAFVLAKPVLNLVFGPGYEGALEVLRVMVWFLPLSMLNSLAGHTLLAAGSEQLFLRNTALGVGAAILANLVLVPLLGARGAAISIVAGEASLLALMGASLLKLVKPSLEARTFAPLLAVLVMTAVVCLLRNQNLALSVGSGALTYSLLLLLLRGVTLTDFGPARDR
jgi:O-antigen/teichoic acid export membrane protein